MKFYIESRFNEESLDLKEKLKRKLKEIGYIEDKDNPDIVFTLGGDGKILNALRLYFNQLDTVKFICVNTGTLGFYSDYDKDELDKLINDLQNNSLKEVQYGLLEVKFDSQEKTYYAINELRLEHRFYSTKLNIFINDEFFECSYGNGINLCTSFGSSAYNRALRGPLVNPELDVMIMSEIAPMNFTQQRSLMNPLVLSPNDIMTIRSDDFTFTNIGLDNFLVKDKDIKSIEIKVSKKKVKFLTRDHLTYYGRVKNKFFR